jgi:hypothetical protein
VAVYALTLQIPLEGKLCRGGIVGVIKTQNGEWIHCQQHGHQTDFFISTREVSPFIIIIIITCGCITLQEKCMCIFSKPSAFHCNSSRKTIPCL